MKSLFSHLILFFCLVSAAPALELWEADILDMIPSGFSPGPGPYYSLFCEAVEKGEESEELFRKCYQDGKPLGRFYGALGLWTLNEEEGLKALRSLIDEGSMITVVDGCFRHKVPVGYLASSCLHPEDGERNRLRFIPGRDWYAEERARVRAAEEERWQKMLRENLGDG